MLHTFEKCISKVELEFVISSVIPFHIIHAHIYFNRHWTQLPYIQLNFKVYVIPIHVQFDFVGIAVLIIKVIIRLF
jgi:hypothetical protein